MAQVEVQSAEVVRAGVVGRLHLGPLIDSSNKSPMEVPSDSQAPLILNPEPCKPVPGPKPRLTPKPFTVEKNTSIRPILAPKPQPKPRPDQARLSFSKPELPSSPKPALPDSSRSLPATAGHPTPTTFKPTPKPRHTPKPVVQQKPLQEPLRPARSPAEVLSPKRQSFSQVPAVPEWLGIGKAEGKERSGASLTRAKSMGFLSQLDPDIERIGEKEKERLSATTKTPFRINRSSRPVSAIYLPVETPTESHSPTPTPLWVSRRPLSTDLTSKFESGGLSVHRRPRAGSKENTPDGDRDSGPTRRRDMEKGTDSSVTQLSKMELKSEKEEEEGREDYRNGEGIKRRISLLFDSVPLSPVTGEEPCPQLPPTADVDIPVGVKQRIKKLTEDIPAAQASSLRAPFKARPLPTDLTKRAVTDGHNPSSILEYHCHKSAADKSKFVAEKSEELSSSPTSPAEKEIEDGPSQNESTAPEKLEDSTNQQGEGKHDESFSNHILQDQLAGRSEEGTEQSHKAEAQEACPSGGVQTVRAALFENVVEKHTVHVLKETGSGVRPRRSLSLRQREGGDSSWITAAPPSPVRVEHVLETLPSVGERRAQSVQLPPAQLEDKAMTLRTRRSRGDEPAQRAEPRVLRIGALQKWVTSGMDRGGLERKGMGRDEGDMERLKQMYVGLERDVVPEIEMNREAEMQKLTEVEQEKDRVRKNELEKERQKDFERQRHLEVETERFRQIELEREREKELNRLRQIELEREKQIELERERLRQIELEKELERERQREFEKQRQVELERERLRQIELDKEMQKELEREKQIELERERFRQIELQKERRKELERRRQVELERERLRQIELERERLRQIELERQTEQERQRQVELERQRQIELEKDRLRQIEFEKEKQKELERQKLRQIELERERQFELEKDRLRKNEFEKEKQKLVELERQKLVVLEKEKRRQIEIERHKRELERQKEFDLLNAKQKQIELDNERMRQIDIDKKRQKQIDLERQKKAEQDKEVEMQHMLERQMHLEQERKKQLDMDEAGAAKRLKILEGEDSHSRPRVTYFALTGQMQESVSHGEDLLFGSPTKPGRCDSDRNVGILRRDPSLNTALERRQISTNKKLEEVGHGYILEGDGKDVDHERQNLLEFQRMIQVKMGKQQHRELELKTEHEHELQRQKMRQERRYEAAACLHPTVLDLDSVDLTRSSELKWKDPFHMSILDIDSLSSQVHQGASASPALRQPRVERMLLRQQERSSPQRRWSGVPAEVSKAEQSTELLSIQQDSRAKDVLRMRSRSVSRRPPPAEHPPDGALSRMRSRSAHRERGRPTWEQLKQCVSAEEEGRDTDTLVQETDSQYGTWETGLHTEDSLTPPTPTSDSNLSSLPQKPTSPLTTSDLETPDALTPAAPFSLPEVETDPVAFPETSTTLLDSSALRSRVQLSKRRTRRTLPSRAARHSAALSVPEEADGGSTPDWRFCDSTEEKPDSPRQDADSEEPPRPVEPRLTPSHPQRVSLFPGMDPSALKAHLKKRGDIDNQTDGPSPSQPTRSPKSPFLPRAARVLPPAGPKENEEESSPQWLRELKSKKRLSQYDSET